jgi:hypothetical protein
VWRSLVAHLHGVQGVASSNPATPTIRYTKASNWKQLEAFFYSPTQDPLVKPEGDGGSRCEGEMGLSHQT